MIVALTGSIGMGKSTTSAMFAEAGVPVWDADAVVHALYAKNGAAVRAIAARFPSVIDEGAVSRPRLRQLIAEDPTTLRAIEQIVHPLVAQDRANFLRAHDGQTVLLDIPLLFETGADAQVDKVIVVSAPAEVQRARVLERGTMTEAEFDTILAKQVPDVQKRTKADYVIETVSLDHAKAQVREILADLEKQKNA